MKHRLPILGQAPSERKDAIENRQRILAALRQLLRERPIEDITMDDVALAAGVGKGTLYRRFTDRTQLLHALLDEEERKLQARALRGFDLPPTATPCERLRIFIDALISFTFEHAALLAQASPSTLHPAQRFTHPVYAWQRFEVVRLLAPLEGQLRAQIDADLVLALLDPPMLWWQLDQGAEPATLRARVLEFVTSALASQKESALSRQDDFAPTAR